MILGSFQRNLLTLLAGSSLPLAFAPFSIFPIAVLSLALLLIRWRNCSPSQAFWQGLLFGIGMFGTGVSWIFISIHQFGHLPIFVALLLTISLVAFLALYPAGLGWLLARFFPTETLTKLVLVIPASWTLSEWLRSWLFTGFPWLSIGYSQIDSPLQGFAPLIGIYGLAWLILLTASLLIVAYHRQRLALITFLAIWGSGELLSQVTWSKPLGNPLKVALIQGNIPQDFKWLPSYQNATLQRYLELSQAHRDVDLMIWPETAIPLFYHEVPEVIDYLTRQHLTHHLDFLVGIPVMNQNNEYFNAVMSISQKPGFYYKRHLVPFGEYIPWQTTLGKLLKILDVPMSEFANGAAIQDNLYAAQQSIGISICYEDVVTPLIHRSLPTASFLVNVSNDAWFGDSLAPHQHLEMARMRALETGRYLLRATNTGISAVIDMKGRIVAQSPQFQLTALRAQVQPYQGLTPYTRIGDYPLIICLFLSILLGKAVEKRGVLGI